MMIQISCVLVLP